jgi:hypothetical protein
MLSTCLLEPVSLSHHAGDLAESGASLGDSGNLGEGLSRSQTGYRLEPEQLQCQTRLALRARAATIDLAAVMSHKL